MISLLPFTIAINSCYRRESNIVISKALPLFSCQSYYLSQKTHKHLSLSRQDSQRRKTISNRKVLIRPYVKTNRIKSTNLQIENLINIVLSVKVSSKKSNTYSSILISRKRKSFNIKLSFKNYMQQSSTSKQKTRNSTSKISNISTNFSNSSPKITTKKITTESNH